VLNFSFSPFFGIDDGIGAAPAAAAVDGAAPAAGGLGFFNVSLMRRRFFFGGDGLGMFSSPKPFFLRMRSSSFSTDLPSCTTHELSPLNFLALANISFQSSRYSIMLVYILLRHFRRMSLMAIGFSIIS